MELEEEKTDEVGRNMERTRAIEEDDGRRD